MNHLYILGDSNARFLIDPFTNSATKPTLSYDTVIDNTNIHLKGFLSKSAYKIDNEFLDGLVFEEGSTVLFYFGMIDVRSFATRYNNIEKVALKYTKTVKEYFRDKNIRFGFIEPIPTPEIDDWIKAASEEVYNWVSGSLEEREIAHNKFVSIISSEELFIPIIGPILDSYFLDSRITDDFNHLNAETNKRLLTHILSRVT
jgi:hypothetical protein